MMRSECVWAFGEGSNFQLGNGPQYLAPLVTKMLTVI